MGYAPFCGGGSSAMANMTFARDLDLLLLIHNKTDPSGEEWSAYCAAIRGYQRSDDPVSNLLVVSEGGGPNARQRREVIESFQPRQAPTAVCANSAIARGITTAI